MKGYIQLYTGDGRGHTDAALGLALRAAGARLKVFIASFGMSIDIDEFAPLNALNERIEFEHFGNCRQSADDYEEALKGPRHLKRIIADKKFDVVILIDVNTAVEKGQISANMLIDICSLKAEGTELVLTGKGATAEIVEMADLVTEMTDISASR